MDGREVDYTVIPSDNGTLLPRDWPKPYHPIHRAAGDHSIIQSHLIEYVGDVVVGIPERRLRDDGRSSRRQMTRPTRSRTRPAALLPWDRAGGRNLDRFGYLRSAAHGVPRQRATTSICAKRYRRYVMDSGLYRLAQGQDRAQRPGRESDRCAVHRNARAAQRQSPARATYDPKDPAKNYRLDHVRAEHRRDCGT